MKLIAKDIVKGKCYTLKEGTGSIYHNDYSLGYFQSGSIISFGNIIDDNIEATIEGKTFKVTSDASFGNRGSTSRESTNKVNGLMPLTRLPSVEN